MMKVALGAAPDWLDVSRETMDRFDLLVALVQKWTPVVNLISKASSAQIWDRHVYDSAQVFSARPPESKTWVDLGSGAGFPGLVVAILAKEHQPGLQVTLVEADQRKATFLSQAVRLLGLSSIVIPERIETLEPQGADVVSARALAPLTVLCGYAHRHLAPGGLAVFLKGAQAAEEVLDARKAWRFDLIRQPSRTDPAATILELRDIAHV
jgi:16S rRNA (guanine527-N7)-methyltransferase